MQWGPGLQPWKVLRRLKLTKAQAIGRSQAQVVEGLNATKSGGKAVVESAADLAVGWQGKGAYLGVDKWRNITIGEGKFVVGGLPGQSNYYTTLSGLQRSGLSKEIYSKGYR